MGDGLPVKDSNFNSGSFRYWVPENSSQAEIRKDDSGSNYYLAVAGESRVTQHITGLEQGRGYVVSAMVKTSGKRPGMLEIDCGGVKKSQYSADYDTKTVIGNAFDNWSQIRVYFTADSGEADVSLAGLSGSGAVYFDDIRIYEEEDLMERKATSILKISRPVIPWDRLSMKMGRWQDLRIQITVSMKP